MRTARYAIHYALQVKGTDISDRRVESASGHLPERDQPFSKVSAKEASPAGSWRTAFCPIVSRYGCHRKGHRSPEVGFEVANALLPDRKSEQREIDRWHSKGFHYVGDWHTHPESVPSPSGRDSESIRDCFVKSKHHLLGFLLIIVGTAPLPEGLYVSLNDIETALPLVSPKQALPQATVCCDV